MLNRKIASTLAAIALTTAGLSACGSSSDSSGDQGGDSGDKNITLGYIPSWTDGLSTAYLLQNRLTSMGYTVKMQELTEPAPLYAGLAKGDIDIYPSAWPEVTHKSYMDKFGKKIEDLGAYYDNAKLTMAVPTYSKVDSIEQLQTNKADFDDTIIGIEPGAGLTKVVQDDVIPDYKLDLKLKTSSTTAMLAELKKATDAKKEIVVTLWRPFWANSAFPVKDLKDPKGALGKAEGLHFLATDGFEEDHADAADFIEGIELDDSQYGELEDMVVNQYGKGKEAQAVAAWLKKNPDVLPAAEKS